MKRKMTVAVGALLLAVPSHSSAQIMASEQQTIVQKISGTTIEVEYSRPSARGRDSLFGGVVHWGEVWTPGANNATELRISEDFEFGGEKVPAGAYTLWLQPNESEPWRFMLHADTSLFHIPHPSIDDGFLVVPVEPHSKEDFTETFTIDLQTVRADGAELVIRWGRTEIAVPLGIDPGFQLAVAPEEAARYSGRWLVDRSFRAMAPERIEEIRTDPDMTPEQLEGFERYLESTRTPQPMRILYGEEAGILSTVDEADLGEDRSEMPEYQNVLLPRAEGIFAEGYLWHGELAGAWGDYLWEFTFDEGGRAIGFEVRDYETDELTQKGCRLEPDQDECG